MLCGTHGNPCDCPWGTVPRCLDGGVCRCSCTKTLQRGRWGVGGQGEAGVATCDGFPSVYLRKQSAAAARGNRSCRWSSPAFSPCPETTRLRRHRTCWLSPCGSPVRKPLRVGMWNHLRLHSATGAQLSPETRCRRAGKRSGCRSGSLHQHLAQLARPGSPGPQDAGPVTRSGSTSSGGSSGQHRVSAPACPVSLGLGHSQLAVGGAGAVLLDAHTAQSPAFHFPCGQLTELPGDASVLVDGSH